MGNHRRKCFTTVVERSDALYAFKSRKFSEGVGLVIERRTFVNRLVFFSSLQSQFPFQHVVKSAMLTGSMTEDVDDVGFVFRRH